MQVTASPLIYRRLAGPLAPVIDLARARRHLRIDAEDDGEDDAIEAAIAAAVAHCDGRDGILNRALVTQTWEALADRTAWTVVGGASGFLLDFGPVRSVTALEALVDGAYVVVPAGDWRVIHRPGGRTAIVPSAAGGWPVADRDAGAWRITFTAGFGDTGESVPAPIRSAILLMVSDLYEHRDAKQAANIVDNPTVDRLLAPYRRVGL